MKCIGPLTVSIVLFFGSCEVLYLDFDPRNDRPELVERMWSLINNKLWHDSRLRCDTVDLYFALYGRRKPFCLPIPGKQSSEKKLSLSIAVNKDSCFTKKFSN